MSANVGVRKCRIPRKKFFEEKEKWPTICSEKSSFEFFVFKNKSKTFLKKL